MFFYLKNFLRSLCVTFLKRVGRRGAGPRPPFRVAVLTEFLRGSLNLIVDHEPATVRALERPTPLTWSLWRRVHLKSDRVAGVEVLRIIPKAAPRGHLLYLHGGGYTLCSTDTHRGLLAHLAAVCGVEVIAPNYRLAPEHPFPAALEDALAVYQQLIETEVDPDRFWIGGDSAGGGLTLATLLNLRGDGQPLPRGAVLLSPWVDLTCRGNSIIENASSDYLLPEALSYFARHYLDQTPPTNPLASPLLADLSGLPSLLIQLGGGEVLLSEGEDLARRAQEADVDVTLRIWDGAIHAFQIFAPIVPEASEAVRDIAGFMDRTAE